MALTTKRTSTARRTPKAIARPATWTKMVDDVLESAPDLYSSTRSAISEQFSEFQRLSSGGKGDGAVQYLQKTHWALLDMLALSAMDHDVVIDLLRLLTARVEALEVGVKSAPGMIYRGVFAHGEAYDSGNMVTFGGSLWHCNQATAERPGDGSKAWTLAVKRGRDGKDAQA